MKKLGYDTFIKTYIQAVPDVQPIYSAEVALVFAEQFNLPLPNSKAITNVYLKRLADGGHLKRFIKGVYYKPKQTVFGNLKLDPNQFAFEILTRKEGQVIGYETGPSLLNRMGLTTQVPRKIYVATNDHRRRLTNADNVIARKPATLVTAGNVKYLKVLDMIKALNKPDGIDASNPEKIIRNYILKNELDEKKLIVLARKHYAQKVVMKTIDVALNDEPSHRI